MDTLMARARGLISGAHIIQYSRDAEKDRRFLRDVLRLPHIDAGEGWLIFALPPSELAVHPTEGEDAQELFLICRDISQTLKSLRQRKVKCSRPRNLSWGTIVRLTLPSGAKVGLYQPKHPLANG
jgi:hypothetical protein